MKRKYLANIITSWRIWATSSKKQFPPVRQTWIPPVIQVAILLWGRKNQSGFWSWWRPEIHRSVASFKENFPFLSRQRHGNRSGKRWKRAIWATFPWQMVTFAWKSVRPKNLKQVQVTQERSALPSIFCSPFIEVFLSQPRVILLG